MPTKKPCIPPSQILSKTSSAMEGYEEKERG
jgi:hypothetical protein